MNSPLNDSDEIDPLPPIVALGAIVIALPICLLLAVFERISDAWRNRR